MNTLSFVTYLLSRKKNLFQMGATEEEIMESLNLKGKNKTLYLYNILINLSNYIAPLGLNIKFNPIDAHWFLAHDFETTELIQATSFDLVPRLAATLLCIIALCLKNSGTTNSIELKKLRKKQDVSQDLKELEELGYIEIDKPTRQKVSLTPLIGYRININKLYTQLTQGKNRT